MPNHLIVTSIQQDHMHDFPFPALHAKLLKHEFLSMILYSSIPASFLNLRLTLCVSLCLLPFINFLSIFPCL